MLYIRVCCILDSHDLRFVPCLYYHPSILEERLGYKRVMYTPYHFKGMVQVDKFESGYKSLLLLVLRLLSWNIERYTENELGFIS